MLPRRSKIIDLTPFMGINRKACFKKLIWNDASESNRSADLNSVTTVWEVYFVDENGDKVINPMFKTYEKQLIANNQTLVNPETGEYVDMTLPSIPENAVGEYDYFCYIADFVSILVTDFILQAGNRASQMGRFDN